MLLMKPNFILILLILLCITTIWKARSLIAPEDRGVQGQESISILDIKLAKEQSVYTAAYYYQHPELFTDLRQVQKKMNDTKDAFWLKETIRIKSDAQDKTYILAFNHLTDVQLNIFDERGQILSQRKAGLFCKQKDIMPGDAINFFKLNLLPDSVYTMLLRVQHNKGYTPVLNFNLYEQAAYLQRCHQNDITHALMEGAIVAFLLYIALAYLISRYRPYVWLFTFLFFIGGYSLLLQPNIMSLLFPQHPELGASMISLMSRLAGISFYMLTIDFLNLKYLDSLYYRLSKIIIFNLCAVACFILINNYFFSNYNYSNYITIFFGVVHMLFFFSLYRVIWYKIDQQQRYLAYGTVFFVTGLAAMVYSGIMLEEQAIAYLSILTQLFALAITMLLLLGIRLKLRKTEKEQHRFIQNLVRERTIKLEDANEKLSKQQELLVLKNGYIQSLIEELNHRVKNNFQLLYSLGNLYIGKVGHRDHVLQVMQDRIHAMLVVNQLLLHDQREKLHLYSLFSENIIYLQQIYDPKKCVTIRLDLDTNYSISVQLALPMALILTELLTNSYKYAFPSHHLVTPECNVYLRRVDKKAILSITDNGIGCAEVDTRSSFGLSLVEDLCRQLKGEMEFSHKQGFNYKFEFDTLF